MRKNRVLAAGSAAAFLVLLILDTKTAINGASEGMELCIKVLIPSLFPFFIVTSYLNALLMGLKVPGLRALGSLLHIPAGSDSLLLLGLIGGYPVGAQLIADAYNKKKISRRTGQIMLGYCSNAGPAFIFGVTSTLFSSVKFSFVLWGIHMLSALLTGFLLPKPEQSHSGQYEAGGISVASALKKSITICASVCGWVVVFKIVLEYLENYLVVGPSAAILLSGFLELSNGCVLLGTVQSDATRFILCAAFLSFGGICVMMQTVSVTQGLGIGLYIPGKIIQTSISIILAALLSLVIFEESNLSALRLCAYILSCIVVIAGAEFYAKKSCGNAMKNNV